MLHLINETDDMLPDCKNFGELWQTLQKLFSGIRFVLENLHEERGSDINDVPASDG
jgi:hypothetical protein